LKILSIVDGKITINTSKLLKNKACYQDLQPKSCEAENKSVNLQQLKMTLYGI
jgi:hypothetical protein